MNKIKNLWFKHLNFKSLKTIGFLGILSCCAQIGVVAQDVPSQDASNLPNNNYTNPVEVVPGGGGAVVVPGQGYNRGAVNREEQNRLQDQRLEDQRTEQQVQDRQLQDRRVQDQRLSNQRQDARVQQNRVQSQEQDRRREDSRRR